MGGKHVKDKGKKKTATEHIFLKRSNHQNPSLVRTFAPREPRIRRAAPRQRDGHRSPRRIHAAVPSVQRRPVREAAGEQATRVKEAGLACAGGNRKGRVRGERI
jgi:hypothetical protein